MITFKGSRKIRVEKSGKGREKTKMEFKQHKRNSSGNSSDGPFFQKERNTIFSGESHTAFFNTSPIQPKLTVNQPYDSYEKEADSMADKVVQRRSNPDNSAMNATPFFNTSRSVKQYSAPGQEVKLQKEDKKEEKDLQTGKLQTKPIFETNADPLDSEINVHRKCAACEKEEQLQKKSDKNSSKTAPAHVESSLSSSKGRGNPLPAGTLAEMGSSFGADFSAVRIYNDNAAVKMNKDLNAQAFTHGSDIYFNSGKYNPETGSGKHLLAHELTHVIQQRSLHGMISRKIDVPFAKARPVNSKNPRADSQGKVVEKLLNKLCIEGGIVVSGGNVVLPVDLCDLPGPIDGNMALTKAEQSKTKTGCTCLCDLVKSNHVVKLIINDGTEGTTLASGQDAEKPGVGSGSTVEVPSPDTPQTLLPTKSGKMSPIDHVINLGHELCGHAFFNMRGEARKDQVAQRGRGGHQATVERENLIRDEQGVERRATFREPFCGEDPGGSFIEECKKWREEFNKINGTNFKIQDTIPVNPFEEKPADFRIEVGFNKDMPLRGFNAASSFNASVTSKGKEMFGFALAVFQDNPDKKFQLEAHASSDKPAGDPDYNRLLSERRVQLILSQLIKRGIDPKKLEDKKDSSCSSIDTGLKNCSDTEAGAPGNSVDRKVVIRIF